MVDNEKKVRRASKYFAAAWIIGVATGLIVNEGDISQALSFTPGLIFGLLLIGTLVALIGFQIRKTRSNS